MKVRVKLFGILQRTFPNHEQKQGLEVEIRSGASVAELLAHLHLQDKQIGIVTVDQEIVSSDHVLCDGNVVCVFQPLFGG